ncbi:Smr/MutS family protein [Tateyamaria omphalii]|uniref:DNA mismatch repair protein MutS n=1 Tax=Tateyamaria omphalii TaxID=299262 RepID=A0A1P8MYE3_9RHOB|nr:Smr/MutS family protein [Tateyamaria omphalii]APX13107.1 DNA mismatch repair protein MutS [Tateyamaria omphalii]
MTRRKLRPEEEDLWRKVVDKTDRLHPEKPFHPDDFVTTPSPAPRSRQIFEVAPARPNGRPAGSKTSVNLTPSIVDQVAAQPVQMDRKAFAQMKRGKLQPEGKLDLHGMTTDRAHPALIRFILSAHGQGKRLVLVVTGKGKHRDDDGPIPVRFGVLRHQVPQWLSMPPLSSVVLQVSQANVRHGGGGAYYVYLRRQR